jgi:hypothetical protein
VSATATAAIDETEVVAQVAMAHSECAAFVPLMVAQVAPVKATQAQGAALFPMMTPESAALRASESPEVAAFVAPLPTTVAAIVLPAPTVVREGGRGRADEHQSAERECANRAAECTDFESHLLPPEADKSVKGEITDT